MSSKKPFGVRRIPPSEEANKDEFKEAIDELERREEQEGKTSDSNLSPSDKKGKRKKWFARLGVREDVHNIIYMAAIEKGQTVEEFHQCYMESTLPFWRDLQENMSPAVKLYWDIYESNRLIEMRDDAFRLAAELERYPMPSLYEKLVDICTTIGVDIEDLRKVVKKDPYGIAILASASKQSTDNKKNCMKWFAHFSDSKDEIPSKELLSSGAKSGYSERSVRECASECGWVPRKVSLHWSWVKSPISRLAQSVVAIINEVS